MTISQQVREFHETYDQPIRTVPTINVPELQLRLDLILEEVTELQEALEASDIVEVADALGDIAYVVYGAALTFGIPLDEIVDEIHRSNMSKLGADGKPVYRESDRKVLKGESYFPPTPGIERILAEATDRV